MKIKKTFFSKKVLTHVFVPIFYKTVNTLLFFQIKIKEVTVIMKILIRVNKYRNKWKSFFLTSLNQMAWTPQQKTKEYKGQLWHFQLLLKIGILVFWTFNIENVQLQIKLTATSTFFYNLLN